jgi:hypothetical protein
MGQNWVIIDGFPRYLINPLGQVLDSLRGIIITPHPVTGGALAVRIKDAFGEFHTRSVKVMVAERFVDLDVDPEYFDVPSFDTPILLDNDQQNVFASNIRWRPRWFAWKYAHQFGRFEDWYFRGPVINIHNQLKFENVMSAGVHYGLLFEDIYAAAKAYEEGYTDLPQPIWPLAKSFSFIN